MAIKIFRGDAQPQVQKTLATPANIESGDKFTLTINLKDVTVESDVAEALVGGTQEDLLAELLPLIVTAVGQYDNTIAEFAEVSASLHYGNGTSKPATAILLTGKTDGTPFTVTASTTNKDGSAGVTITTLQDGDAGDNEKQQVEICGTATGGTFTLTFDGQTTGTIAYNASASTVDTALEALSNIDAGDVSVTGSAGGPWTVEFLQTYANVDVPLITGDGSSVTKATSGYAVVVKTNLQGDDGTNEIQEVSLPSPTGGTFTLTYVGQTTSSLAYNATAAAVELALAALSNIAGGDVSVTGDDGGPYLVEFTGTLAATNVAELTGSGIALTGVSSVDVEETTKGGAGTDEVQTITFAYDSSFGHAVILKHHGQDTGWLDIAGASAGTVKRALERVFGANNVGVTVTDPTNTGGTNRTRDWVITFRNDWGNQDVAALTYTASPSLTVTVTETTKGSSDPVDEVQTVRLTPTPTGGTFTLTYAGQTTAAIAYNAAASAVTTAVEALSNVTDVTVAASGSSGSAWAITFVDPGDTDLELMTGSAASLTGGNINVEVDQDAVAATDEVQTVSLSGCPEGGTFTLSFDGQTTAAIAFDALASDVESAVEALSNVTAVTVTSENTTEGPWRVEFADPGGNVPEMTGTATSLSGAGIIVATTQTATDPVNEIQEVKLTGSPTGGTFTLTWDGQTTSAITYNASASILSGALESLSNIAVGEVSVTDTSTAGTPRWQVEWVGSAGATDQNAATGNGGSLTVTGSQTYTIDTSTDEVTQAAISPNHWGEAENWSGGTAPVAADIIFVENTDVDIKWDLAAFTGVTFAEVHFPASYTGKAGLSRHGDDYYEYRGTQIQLGATKVFVGRGEGAGSPMIALDLEAVASTVDVHGTGVSDSDLPALLLEGTNTANVLRVYRGSVGGAVEPGDDLALATLMVGFRTEQDTDAIVELGTGVSTLTNVLKLGGDLVVRSAAGTVRQEGGTLRIEGTGAVTLLDVWEGTVLYESTGTITTLEVQDGGRVEFNGNMEDKTVTTTTLYGGSALIDSHRTVTWTNDITLKASLTEVELDLGTDIVVAVSDA